MSDDRPTQPYAASAAVAAPPPVPPQGQAPVRDRTGLAIAMMCAVSLIFAFQDVFSRILGGGYPPVLIVMIRYWVFALFVIALVARQPGGLKRAIRTKRPLTQIARGVPTLLCSAMLRSSLFRFCSFKDAACALKDNASAMAAVGTIRRSMKLS